MEGEKKKELGSCSCNYTCIKPTNKLVSSLSGAPLMLGHFCCHHVLVCLSLSPQLQFYVWLASGEIA